MLDDDNPATNDLTEAGTGEAPAAPVVKKTTRKAPARRTAKKAAAEPATGSDVPAADTSADMAADTAADTADAPAAAKRAPRKTAAKRTSKKAAAAPSETPADTPAEPTAGTPAPEADAASGAAAVDEGATQPATAPRARKSSTRKSAAKKAAPDEAPVDADAVADQPDAPDGSVPAAEPAAAAVLFQAPDAGAARPRRTRKKAAAAPDAPEADATSTSTDAATGVDGDAAADAGSAAAPRRGSRGGRGRSRKAVAVPEAAATDEDAATDELEEAAAALAAESAAPEDAEAESLPADSADAAADDQDDADTAGDDDTSDGEGSASRRRRRRGGRRRRKSGEGSAEDGSDEGDQEPETSSRPAKEPKEPKEPRESGDGEAAADDAEGNGEGSSRRRRRRRRSGEDGGGNDDEPQTTGRARRSRTGDDQITALAGSTRLEAKKQRRREGREAGRRRAPIVSEAEFLARRESVDRVMVIRQREELTQIAVLEDKVLVEHYVARESQTSLIGNVYLGRVQNVLPSMEAAFIDIGKGRNAVLYAGEVNWSALGHKEGQPRKIESVLSSGQSVLVQVTKDPVGHKGARLTSQVSLAGRFLVYVPDGTTSGISRKLPDTERNRLKTLLKEIVPDTAGVIVRTAAEGASEDELTRDVERLKARWEDIEKKAKGSAPQLLYGEPDLTLKVVRDLFTEDFARLVIEGDDAWETVRDYVARVAPDLQDRLERFEPAAEGRDAGKDAFAAHRIDEQIAKGLDRKVWLPSGGSLVIDRTEAMTVVDVNTGKFTGSGGNLEETVKIVRQLRLRDIGGIIVVDFIDMVLESNRDLVVRRLVECLGRDRTRHQVAEVTSLGLVQMTRKRIGTGLLEAFSENCEHCNGRGVVIRDTPVEPGKGTGDDEGRRSNRRNRGRKGSGNGENGDPGNGGSQQSAAPSPKDVAAMARHDRQAEQALDEPRAEAPEPEEPQVEEPQVEEPQVEEPQAEEPQADERAEEPQVEEPAPEPTPKVAVEPVPEPAQEPAATAEPAPPRVVTRTRRRAASRPAGPPVVQAAESTEPVTASPGIDGAGAANGAPAVEHVPVKKRGARKR